MRRAAVSEANRRHCPEERSDEGIAEAKAEPGAARPERSEGHAQNKK